MCERCSDYRLVSAAMIHVVNIDTKGKDSTLYLSLDSDLIIEASFSDYERVFDDTEDDFDFFEPLVEHYNWLNLVDTYDA